MKQLEVLNIIRKQSIRDEILSTKTVYFDTIYIYFNEAFVTISNYSRDEELQLVVIEDINATITKEHILSKVYGGESNTTTRVVGFGSIYLDGASLINEYTIRNFNLIVQAFQEMNEEYDEFIDYLNYHLDEIILKGEFI